MLALLPWGRASGEQPAFPVPRAESEFRELVRFAKSYRERPDVPRYEQLVVPYAPLDLRVRAAASADEGSLLRNFYLAVTARMFGEDPKELTNAFHCGRPCTLRRRAHLVANLGPISELLDLMRSVPRLRLVAQWWEPGHLRVNDTFIRGDRAREAIPSPVMGFVPSGSWRAGPAEAFYADLGLSPSHVDTLTGLMQKLSLVAVVVGENGTSYVLLTGLSDNLAGLAFPGPGQAPPKPGATLPTGEEYRVTEHLSPGVYFFETT